MVKLTNLLWILLALIIQSAVVATIIFVTAGLPTLITLWISIIIGFICLVFILVILDKYTPMSFSIQIKSDIWIIILSVIGLLLLNQSLGDAILFAVSLVVGIILWIISFVCLVIIRKKNNVSV